MPNLSENFRESFLAYSKNPHNDKNKANDIVLKVLSHGYYKNEKIIKFPKVVVNRSK